MEIEKKKRGRKKREQPTETTDVNINEPNNITISIETEETVQDKIVKKRGRKPKGGKLILKTNEADNKQDAVANIILHLKCSLTELDVYNKTNQTMNNEFNYNPDVPPEIQTYNINEVNKVFTTYEESNNNKSINTKYAYSELNKQITSSNVCQLCTANMNNSENVDDSEINMKDINMKLKQVKINLYKNTLQDKKSACFWCTYEYDNPPCYIPKHEIDDKLYGYGSFCRPECAVAYLMKENLDDSTKFERYHLLNQIYGKVYEYKKNIKPAPNPHYLLEKFYGNLSIQEYRKLLKTEHLLLVVEKPMTRILPELFEDNDNFIMSIYGTSNSSTQSTSNSVYKVKRQSEKQQGPSKTSIMRDKFGLSS
jgi:hypothetical protein